MRASFSAVPRFELIRISSKIYKYPTNTLLNHLSIADKSLVFPKEVVTAVPQQVVIGVPTRGRHTCYPTGGHRCTNKRWPLEYQEEVDIGVSPKRWPLVVSVNNFIFLAKEYEAR